MLKRGSNFNLSRLRSLAAFVLSAWLICATTSAAMAESPRCRGLRSNIAMLARGNGGSVANAVQRQRSELARTAAYANSLGCSNRKFLFLGSDPPRQCGPIDTRIQQMQNNLAALEQRGSERGSLGAIEDLRSQYAAECTRGEVVARQQPRGLFDQLFGGRQPQYNEPPPPPADDRRDSLPRRRDFAPSNDLIIDSEITPHHRGGSAAVCVRQCDGAFFPISYSARSSNLDALQNLCEAQCPNAKVSLFTYTNGADIGTASALDGSSYGDLPAAFKFRTKFDPACGCKGPNQTWVQALANAEEILGRQQKSDIIVTQQKSDQMAMPLARLAVPNSSAPAIQPRANTALQAGSSLPASDPTAEPKAQKFRTVRGPGGVKRQVRIIVAPQ